MYPWVQTPTLQKAWAMRGSCFYFFPELQTVGLVRMHDNWNEHVFNTGQESHRLLLISQHFVSGSSFLDCTIGVVTWREVFKMRLSIIIVNWEIFCWPAGDLLTHAQFELFPRRVAIVACLCDLPRLVFCLLFAPPTHLLVLSQYFGIW